MSAIVTFFVKPSTNDLIAKEDAEASAYLEAHGYDASKTAIRSEALPSLALPSLITTEVIMAVFNMSSSSILRFTWD